MARYILMALMLGSSLTALTAAEDLLENKECFWPPDFIPHPDIPGTHEPSGPGEPEMA